MLCIQGMVPIVLPILKNVPFIIQLSNLTCRGRITYPLGILIRLSKGAPSICGVTITRLASDAMLVIRNVVVKWRVCFICIMVHTYSSVSNGRLDIYPYKGVLKIYRNMHRVPGIFTGQKKFLPPPPNTGVKKVLAPHF